MFDDKVHPSKGDKFYAHLGDLLDENPIERLREMQSHPVDDYMSANRPKE